MQADAISACAYNSRRSGRMAHKHIIGNAKSSIHQVEQAYEGVHETLATCHAALDGAVEGQLVHVRSARGAAKVQVVWQPRLLHRQRRRAMLPAVAQLRRRRHGRGRRRCPRSRQRLLRLAAKRVTAAPLQGECTYPSNT